MIGIHPMTENFDLFLKMMSFSIIFIKMRIWRNFKTP